MLLATFASNLGRVQQIINVARKHGRRVGVVGRSMVNNVKIATVGEFRKAVAEVTVGKSLAILVRRGDGSLYVPLKITGE